MILVRDVEPYSYVYSNLLSILLVDEIPFEL